MILHPVACGLAFIAFLLTTGGRTIAATLTGSLVALLTWVLVLISLAVDFTAFGVIKHKVNDQANEALPTAEFGSALWCLVAAFVLHTLAIGLLGLGCVGALRARRDDNKRQTAAAAKKEEGRKKVFGFI